MNIVEMYNDIQEEKSDPTPEPMATMRLMNTDTNEIILDNIQPSLGTLSVARGLSDLGDLVTPLSGRLVDTGSIQFAPAQYATIQQPEFIRIDRPFRLITSEGVVMEFNSGRIDFI
jgi:hypothetical protein